MRPTSANCSFQFSLLKDITNMFGDHRALTPKKITHLCLVQQSGFLIKRHFQVSLAIA